MHGVESKTSHISAPTSSPENHHQLFTVCSSIFGPITFVYVTFKKKGGVILYIFFYIYF